MSNLVLFTKVPQQQQNDRMELFMLSQVDAARPVAVITDDEFWFGRLNDESKPRVQFVLPDSALQRLSLFNHGTQILVDPRLRSQTKAALATVALRVRVPIVYAS